ncbi:MAG: hypothetical protein FIA89_03170 [Geobacter sp.]|nr:hypothetical protein [Geobacter sp.]
MKTIVLTLIAPILAGSAGPAAAASVAADKADSGMLIWFFIGFAVMVLLFQATPALVTFFSMLKGLFSSSPADAAFSPFKSGKNRN